MVDRRPAGHQRQRGRRHGAQLPGADQTSSLVIPASRIGHPAGHRCRVHRTRRGWGIPHARRTRVKALDDGGAEFRGLDRAHATLLAAHLDSQTTLRPGSQLRSAD